MKFSGEINRSFVKNYFFMIFALSFVVSLVSVSSGVLAQHTATVTISPDIANCNQLGNTFTITVENDESSADSIWTVDIYESVDVTNFSCGSPPDGWYLADYSNVGLCRYTASDSTYYIAPGDQQEFTFNAVMVSSSQCLRSFHVATLDDHAPTGEYQHAYPSVSVDCNNPDITKIVGTPKLQGDGFDWWITQSTQIDITGSDSEDTCDLGMDYCRWRYRVDGGAWSDWETYEPGCNGNVSFTISFDEDSVHDIQIECYDKAGNKATLNETDKVDSVPPTTTKVYGTPFYSDGTYDWITSGTTIDLTATDGGEICAVGVDKLYYRVTYIDVPDEYCVADCDFNGDNYNEGPYGWRTVNGNHVQFNISEDSCHLIEFYSVDKLGNTEEVHRQCVFVDNKPPVGTKTVGTPNKPMEPGSPFDWWVSQNTPITLECTDQQPHPVDHEKVCFKVELDGSDVTSDYCDHDLNDDGYCCEDKSYTLYFTEDSNHTLSYYCEDALGNKNEVDTEEFKVDTQAPTITKTVSGKYYGDCNPIVDHQCWLKDWSNGEEGATITVDAQDPENNGCSIDDVKCQWWYKLDGSGEFHVENGDVVSGRSDWLTPPFNITFYDETEHELHIVCKDQLENTNEDVEILYVDSSAPETAKWYEGDKYCNSDPCEAPEWITSNTLVHMDAYDLPNATCAVENIKTFYNVTIADKIYCQSQYDCDSYPTLPLPSDPLNPGSEWLEYTEPFQIPEESCHIIQFYSVDALGNVEEIKHQCVFVDNTPPTVTKTIGDPKVRKPGDVFVYITQNTPITIHCVDQQPHPVGHEKIYYRYRVSDDCQNWGNWTEWFDPGEAETIYFPEDSCHELEYYCEDALGNKADTQSEIDIVDTQPPETTEEITGPKYEKDGKIYLDNATRIHLTCTDKQPHPVGGTTIYYRYRVDEGNGFGPWTTWFEYTEPIWFPEESHHELQYYCEDALGNKETTHDEEYYVDHTPPAITKTYGDPYFSDYADDENGPYTAEWISGSTPIFVEVEDEGAHPSGVKEVWYRYGIVDDEYCKDRTPFGIDEMICEEAELDGVEWIEGSEEFNFTIPEESCHLIEIKAIDNVNKTRIHKQCVFVDTSAPEPDKKVGKPRSEWDGSDAYYYNISEFCQNNPEACWKVTLLTPIELKCTDLDQPHPVPEKEVCFKVGWDGEDVTKDYCKKYVSGGTYDKYGDGYCCMESGTFYFHEETEHKLEYYCLDILGNKGETVDVEYFKVTGTTFNITLNKKWNLISVPFVMLNDSIDEVFKDIKDDVISVWTYDAATDQWYVYTPGPAPDTLTEMKPGWGYWVLTNKDTVLQIGGSLFLPGKTPPDKVIKHGWNLIGYYGNEDHWENEIQSYNGPVGHGEFAYCALYSLGEDLWDKGWTSLVTYWEPDNPYQWKYLDKSDQMDPGAGYWLFYPGTEDAIYAYSTSCGVIPDWLEEIIGGP